MSDPQHVIIEQHGGPEVLTLESFSIPSLAPGRALVEHTAIGVNFIDTYHRSGLYPTSLPHGLGMEAVGVIQALEGVQDDLISGQRVANISGPPGAYATHRVVDADRLIPLPDDLSDEVAAAVTLKGITVEYLITRLHAVQPGEFVLWHGAAGGLGLIACQWLRHLGARVIGTVGTEQKAALAREHGCEFPIVYTRDDFEQEVRALTEGEGVSVVYDGVGYTTFEASLDCLKPRGLYVGVGNASGKPSPLDITTLAQKGSLFLTRPTLHDYTRTREELLAAAAKVYDVVRRGIVRVHIGRRFALADVRAAHEALERRETVGSSLLLP